MPRPVAPARIVPFFPSGHMLRRPGQLGTNTGQSRGEGGQIRKSKSCQSRGCIRKAQTKDKGREPNAFKPKDDVTRRERETGDRQSPELKHQLMSYQATQKRGRGKTARTKPDSYTSDKKRGVRSGNSSQPISKGRLRH